MLLQEKIRRLREREGMTQEELARQICVHRNTVYKWEHGKLIPKVSSMVDMANLFNVDIKFFIEN